MVGMVYIWFSVLVDLFDWLALCTNMWKEGEHGILALLHPWRIFGVGVHAVSDRDWYLLPRETAQECGVPVVQSRSGGGVSAIIYSGIEKRWPGRSGETSDPTPMGGSEISIFILGSTHMPPVPSGRMTGGGDQQDQPPGSLCAPPCVIFHCDPGGGKLGLPPLPSM